MLNPVIGRAASSVCCLLLTIAMSPARAVSAPSEPRPTTKPVFILLGPDNARVRISIEETNVGPFRWRDDDPTAPRLTGGRIHQPDWAERFTFERRERTEWRQLGWTDRVRYVRPALGDASFDIFDVRVDNDSIYVLWRQAGAIEVSHLRFTRHGGRLQEEISDSLLVETSSPAKIIAAGFVGDWDRRPTGIQMVDELPSRDSVRMLAWEFRNADKRPMFILANENRIPRPRQPTDPRAALKQLKRE